MILVVMNPQDAILKRQQAVFQKKVPLHQLHCIVWLIATGLVVLQDAQNAAGIDAAQLRIGIVALLVQRFGDK